MRIELIDDPVFIKIGCFKEERLHGQEVLVTLNATLASDLTPGLSDELERTVDYGSIIQSIDSVLKDREFHLIETAVTMLGLRLLEVFVGLSDVDLIIEKRILPFGIAKGARVRAHETFSRGNLRSQSLGLNKDGKSR